MSRTTKTWTPSEDEQRFILHWGEMGSKWGISRAVAQIHAVLLISDSPLDAGRISEILSLARSNVSTGLKELQSWGLISVVHVLGDRRDHFQTTGDAWQMFTTIADKRVERELEPTLALLSELSAKHAASRSRFGAQVRDIHDLLQTGISFYRNAKQLPVAKLMRLLRFDRTIAKLFKA